jgi:hypothetical protein
MDNGAERLWITPRKAVDNVDEIVEICGKDARLPVGWSKWRAVADPLMMRLS